jgi:hypothetical protein
MRGAPIRIWLVVLSVVIAIALMPGRVSSDSEPPIQAEAACLINFSRFIKWPTDAIESPRDPFVIGIFGNNPFGIGLAQMASAEGRGIEVRSIRTHDDMRACRILFIGSANQKIVTQILASLNGSSVLTVSDADGFLEWGGMIEFSMRDDRVHFAVNDMVVKSAGIHASANLLKLASEVIERGAVETN